MSHGDRNTKFFHATASARRHTNFIKGLKNSRGEWVSANSDLAAITLDYFDKFFTSFNPSVQDLEAVILSTDSVVDWSMNDVLCAPFSAQENRKAIFDMHPSKAPGPDGFTAFFFQKLWPVIGNDITNVALSILNDNGDISQCNSTLITLIPKIKNLVSLKDYRPISLCNTSYKIVARAIINRFRPVLASFIDDYQSAFMPGS